MTFVSRAFSTRCRKTARALLSCLVVGVLSACGGGGGGGTSIQSGQFLDSAVSGLYYETESRWGLTDANGRFYYWPGETVTFRLQGLYIGQALGAAVLTPPMITPSGKHADYSLNVLRLLQSLDSDQTPSNGISLGSWQITQNINLDQSTDNFTTAQGVVDLMSAASATLVSAASAADHFADTVNSLASNGNSNYSVDLRLRTANQATVRLSTCPSRKYDWTLVFNDQTAEVDGYFDLACNVTPPVNTRVNFANLPYVDGNGGSSMKKNAFFVPCGPVCTLAELNQTYTATDDGGKPFTAKVAHLANSREILLTKTYGDPNLGVAYFRLILSAP